VHRPAPLGARLDGVSAVQLAEPGRGRALRSIWSASDSEVLAYMDVDLFTDLNALLPLVAPLLSGHSDVAIGTRLARGSRVIRGPRREVLSRGYNLLLHATLGAGFSDAQCGFKAIRRDPARALLPQVSDGGWFFDTELLVLAERAGLRIHEVPVDWTDDPDSRVRIAQTAVADLRGIVRLGAGRRLGRFLAVGLASTLAYALIYLALRRGLAAQAANAISLLITAVANTAVNRRVTFGISGRRDALRHQARGLIAFAAGLAVTSGAAAYAVARACEGGRTRWLVLAGTLLGLGFLAKMLQAFLVVPGFGLVYLVAGPDRLRARVGPLLAGLGALVVSAGWWVAAVMLTPAADRPYVGGSTSDSILQLALGYSGLGRLDGDETGSVGFAGNRGGGAAFSGASGAGRALSPAAGCLAAGSRMRADFIPSFGTPKYMIEIAVRIESRI
jgi:putative flippase GtrA